MSAVTIQIQDLLLDPQNPRHDQPTGQREVIRALLDTVGEKMVRLAEDIVEYGPSPIDLVMVMPNDKTSRTYTVLEGNRRVAVRKLLKNPGLADGHPTEKQLRGLASRATDLPSEVQSVVVKSRDAARHWQELRHRGEQQGAGVVPWSTEAQQRFSRTRGTQADRALVVIDSLKSTFSEDSELLDLIERVRNSRLTTLGRVFSDPDVRKTLGIEIDGDVLLTHYSKDDLRPAVHRVFKDLAEDLTVTDLKSKQQRVNYIREVGKDMTDAGASWIGDAQPLKAGKRKKAAKNKAKNKAQRKKAKQRQQKRILSGLELVNLGSRVSNILGELQRLDVDRFPNASGILLRVVIELAIGQVYAAKGWNVGNTKLRNQIKKSLLEIDPTFKADEFEYVRKGLSDGESVMAVSTMHAFVHNPHYNPTGTEIRSIAANYRRFLEELDGMA